MNENLNINEDTTTKMWKPTKTIIKNEVLHIINTEYAIFKIIKTTYFNKTELYYIKDHYGRIFICTRYYNELIERMKKHEFFENLNYNLLK